MNADDRLSVLSGCCGQPPLAARRRMQGAWLAAIALHALALLGTPWPAARAPAPPPARMLTAHLQAEAAAPPPSAPAPAKPLPGRPAGSLPASRPPATAVPQPAPDTAARASPVAGLADISPGTLTAPGRQGPSSENTATSPLSSPGNLSEDAHTLRQRCPQQVAPDFPRRAIRAGITAGRIELRLHIAPDGAIRQAEILRAEPEGVFDTAALAAAMQWHCLPAADAGSSARVSFVFKQD